MLGVLGFFRWVVRPVDKLWMMTMSVIGTTLAVPVVLTKMATIGPKLALTSGEIVRSFNSVPYFGKYGMQAMVHLIAPYTASINPMLDSLSETRAQAYLVERPWLQNPFNSVHAVALTNLGEYVSGLIVTSRMDYLNATSTLKYRGIITKLETEFFKKSRGKITATCDLEVIPSTPGKHSFQALSKLYDGNNNHVATVTAYWVIEIQDKASSSSNKKKKQIS
eukprot:m.22924 g.22924  ORF g.22924 m.22924 type:complete len:222 (+) comp5497_c0_seq1:37-702(+)